MISNIKIQRAITVAVSALVFAFAATPPSTFAQAAEAHAVEESASALALDAVIETQIQRRFVEFQRQYLDDRLESIDRWAETVTWWLAGVAIAFTVFGIAVPIIFALSFGQKAREAVKKAQESADRASEAADKAVKHVKEIEKHEQQVKEKARVMLEKGDEDNVASAKVEKPEEIIKSIRQSSEASILKKEIAQADSLQISGEIEKAIEKWRAIANIAEGTNKKISARAWRRVGFLVNDPEDKVFAYSEAIHFDPQSALAYNNRGIAKAKLERYHSAIEDYDEAIRLNPEYSTAYKFRGSAKAKLEEYGDSIKDLDKAIILDPKYTWAYLSRGQAKLELKGIKESRSDFETALDLANKSGNKKLATRISKVIKLFDDRESKKQD